MQRILPIAKINWEEYKTWKYPFPSEVNDFCNINFFYGSNGSGKSSFATLLTKTYRTIHESNNGGLKVFDSDFVNRSLRLSDSDYKIHGVISNFGENNVQAEDELNEKNNELQNVLSNINSITTQVKEAEHELSKKIFEIYNNKKGTAKIKQKPQSKSAIEQIALWENDYNDAKKNFPTVDFENYHGNGAYNDELDELQSLETPSLTHVDTDTISLILEQPYDDNFIPKKTIVDWIELGIKHHQEYGGKQCLFCGNDALDLHLVEERLEKYQKNEKNEKARLLDAQTKNIKTYINVVDHILRDIIAYRKITNVNEAKLKDYQKILEKDLGVIDKKINEMASCFELDKKELDDTLRIIGTIFKEIQDNKTIKIKELATQIANTETLTKGAIGLILSKDSLVATIKENQTSADDSLQVLDKRKQVLNNEIARLKHSKSKLANFAKFVNDVLSTLDMRFYLEPDDEEKDFYIKHKDAHDGQISVNDISEGERNILALIYFIYSLLDKEELIKNEIDIIIMDDPISSLDDNNKFAIIQLITELVEKTKNSKNKQIFILTHSISDFINLTYNYKDDKNITKLYRVYKANHRSSLKPISKRVLSPYQLLYEDVFLFSNLSESDLMNKPDEEAIHIPNSIRQLLEDYCGFRIGIKDINIRHKTDVAKALFGKEIVELSNNEKRKMENILRICNVLSHKANSHPHDIKEVWRASKDLMSIIKQYDKYHHLKMIENVQNS